MGKMNKGALMRLRDFLFINNIRQEDFSEKLCISRRHLNALMNGREPCKKLLAKIIEGMTKEINNEHFVSEQEMLSEYSRRQKE
jgi:hypothetical protein